MGEKLPEKASSAGQVDAFLKKLAAMPAVRPAGPRGRLIFALDATASRQPSWDQACMIQAQMFQAVGQMGGLDVQLVYYRGFHEFEAFPWLDNAAALTQRMTGVFCLGGHTQIARVLKHAIAETKGKRVNALVFVGDCMEEPADNLCHMAGQLGVLGLPIFLFHEGREPLAAATFQQLARLSGGAYCPFDAGSAQQLTELLRAVAVYAAGGLKALQDYSRNAGGKTLLLTRQLGVK
ncbi:MAG TPA: VWA domain-containing protein [Dongiaceae bacterium]|nr:VWA domain-containing protein [Dongiaceae bacterium]